MPMPDLVDMLRNIIKVVSNPPMRLVSIRYSALMLGPASNTSTFIEGQKLLISWFFFYLLVEAIRGVRSGRGKRWVKGRRSFTVVRLLAIRCLGRANLASHINCRSATPVVKL